MCCSRLNLSFPSLFGFGGVAVQSFPSLEAGTFNLTRHRQSARRAGVTKTPTLLLYRQGEALAEYTGPISAQGIGAFAVSALRPPHGPPHSSEDGEEEEIEADAEDGLEAEMRKLLREMRRGTHPGETEDLDGVVNGRPWSPRT